MSDASMRTESCDGVGTVQDRNFPAESESQKLLDVLVHLSSIRSDVDELRNERGPLLPKEPLPMDLWPRARDSDSEHDSASGDGELLPRPTIDDARRRHPRLECVCQRPEMATECTQEQVQALKRHLDDLGERHRELVHHAKTREALQKLEAFAAPLREMHAIVAKLGNDDSASTRRDGPALRPAWAIVDFGEPNPGVLPPTTRKYRRLVFEKLIMSSHAKYAWIACMSFCTRGEYVMGEGGWLLPLAAVESVCAGGVSRRIRLHGRYATSHDDFFNDDLTLTVCTDRTSVVIQFDSELPRMQWLVKLRESIQQRRQEESIDTQPARDEKVGVEVAKAKYPQQETQHSSRCSKAEWDIL